MQEKTLNQILSKKGKKIFFPKKGILSQTADAKKAKINATIGVALNEKEELLILNSIKKNSKFSEKETVAYSPSWGDEELRITWKKKILKENPSISNQISNPIVTSSLTHALSIAGFLFIDEGEEIIVPDLFWENYSLIFENYFNAKLKTFKTFEGKKFNLNGLENELKKGKNKKIVLLNFPNNPSGYTITKKEFLNLQKIIKRQAQKGKKIICIIDDAYFNLTYENDLIKESVFSKISNIHENVLAVKIDGASKELYAWGLRVGFITFGAKNGKKIYNILEDKTAGAIRANLSNTSKISQTLVLNALNDKKIENEKKKNYNLLKKRYFTIKKELRNKKYEKYFEALPFNSGYFMCIKLKNIDTEKLRKKLLDEKSTGVICFNNVIRIAFSSVSTKKISKLFENIYNMCHKLN